VPEFRNLPDISMKYDEFHEEVESSASDSSGSLFLSSLEIPEPFKQELTYLFRDLNLSTEAAEILASRLKDKNALNQSSNNIVLYCTREKHLVPYICQQEFFYCKDIQGLLLKVGVPQYRANSGAYAQPVRKELLQCVFLYSGNRYAFILNGNSIKLKEYSNEIVLQKLDYDSHQICLDLKIFIFLLG